MARTFRLTTGRKIANLLVKGAVKFGVGPGRTHLLIVRGRKSGKEYTTPVNLVERNEETYLVSPYGQVSWVKNARAAGEVELRRGGLRQKRKIEEMTAAGAVPILKDYWQQNMITRPYFDASPDDSEEAFMVEATRHPVFRLL